MENLFLILSLVYVMMT